MNLICQDDFILFTTDAESFGAIRQVHPYNRDDYNMSKNPHNPALHNSFDESGIDKFDGHFAAEESGCTIIINQTVNSIKRLDAAGLYMYLICRPSKWKLNVKHLASLFECNKDKIYSLIDYLISICLLSRLVTRSNGKFSSYSYRLHLRPIEHITDHHSPCLVLPCLEKPDTVKPDTVIPDTYKTKSSLNKDLSHTQEFFLEQNLYTDSEQQRKAIVMRKLCLEDEKAKQKHAELNMEKSFPEVLDECVSHYATQQKPQLVSPQRLQSWIGRESRFQKQQEFNKPKSNYKSQDERAANEQKIREREYQAQQEKRQEIEDAKKLKSIMSQAAQRAPGRPQGLNNLMQYMGLAR